jgi:hypothetical protein
MGIRGVWTLFRDRFTKINPLVLEPLRIGIDMFSLVYTYRAQLDELLTLLNSWSKQGHQLTCVWDGVAPQDKKEIIQQRRSVRESAIETQHELEAYLEQYTNELSDLDKKHLKTAIHSLSWQGWHLTAKIKEDIHTRLGSNVQHHYAKGEADDVLIEMENSKQIDIVVTLDSDLFVMGCPRIWRIMLHRRQWSIEEIFIEDVCNNWNINLSQLQDASFLAGWDRCHLKGIIPMSFESAIHRMKHYGSCLHILQKFNPTLVIDQDTFDRLQTLKEDSKKRWMSHSIGLNNQGYA